MGRREKPIGACNKELSVLALWLRAQRQHANLTYAQLAKRTGFSPATLSRATKGTRVPSCSVVQAFAEGCGADPEKARSLWKKARCAAQQVQKYSAPRPEYVRNFADLHAAMTELRRKAGNPSLRELERNAGQHSELPRSSLSRVLRKQAVPSRDLLKAFVRACGVLGTAQHRAWEAAWSRADEERNRLELQRRRLSPEEAVIFKELEAEQERSRGLQLRMEAISAEVAQLRQNRDHLEKSLILHYGGLEEAHLWVDYRAHRDSYDYLTSRIAYAEKEAATLRYESLAKSGRAIRLKKLREGFAEMRSRPECK
jgi:transcriptional regulator with XRE-family HTH domain